MSVREFPTTMNTKALAISLMVIVALGAAGASVMGVAPGSGLNAVVAQQQQAPSSSVSLQPSSATVDAGQSTTYDVVVEDVQGGVGAYDFTVSVGDSSVASITDLQVAGNPSEQTKDVSIGSDGASAAAVAALADTDDTGSVTIATVTVEGDAAGTSSLDLSVEALGTEGGTSYDVSAANGASITVEEAPTEPDPASFAVSDLDPMDVTVTQGDVIDVSATVENTGGQAATKTVEFQVDGQALAEKDVSLDPGESTTVTFEGIDTGALDPGDYEHGVSTPDDSMTATLTVEAPEPGPANIQVSNLDPTDVTVTQGDVIDVSADVTNTGEQEATSTVQFRVDTDGDDALSLDEALGSKQVTLGPGESTTVTFEDIDTSALAPGEYRHGVVTADDSATATLTVEAPEEPGKFRVTELMAPSTITVGERADVWVDVTNDADEEATQTVEFRLDSDGNGTLEADEVVTSREVTVGAGETETVRFNDLPTDGLAVGDYRHGAFTGDSSETAILTVKEKEQDGGDGDGDGDGEQVQYTRDEISQAKYGHDFANLSAETAMQVQALYNRQPYPDGTSPADLRTREELARDMYGASVGVDDLSHESRVEVQNAYDAQFGPLPMDPAYTRDEIAQAKYGHDFANLSAETTMQVQGIYNRQPFPDGTTPAAVHTREEIAESMFGGDYEESTLASDLSRESAIDVQNAYDEQFAGA